MTCREAAFFDLDGTIIALASEKAFCQELFRERNLTL